MSSAGTDGGGPAHPSPSDTGTFGGINSIFKVASLVWQFTQVFPEG